jgi:hypothetical protein
LPVTAASKNPQTPVTVIDVLCFAQARTKEISGRKPLSHCAPFCLFPPAVACQGERDGSFGLAPRVFVEPCDSPFVSALDAFDSVTASHQRTTSTHASVWSRFGQETCASRRFEGFGVFTTPLTRFSEPVVSAFYQCERFLLEPVPRGRTSNTSVAS